MASNGHSRRWIIVGLIALGVALVATLPMLGSNEAGEGESDSSTASEHDPDGGSASRRIKEECDAVAEATKYEEFVDRRALAVLSWNNMRERAANLEIPVYVKSTADGAIGVSILEIPMREQYLGIWMMSGHLKRDPAGGYLMDPCSAKIIAWESMDRLEKK